MKINNVWDESLQAYRKVGEVEISMNAVKPVPMTGGLTEPEDTAMQVAWLLYRGVYSSGITAVVNRACELYPKDIDPRQLKMCIMTACREMVVELVNNE